MSYQDPILNIANSTLNRPTGVSIPEYTYPLDIFGRRPSPIGFPIVDEPHVTECQYCGISTQRSTICVNCATYSQGTNCARCANVKPLNTAAPYCKSCTCDEPGCSRYVVLGLTKCMRHKGLPKRVSEERELHVPLEDPICKQTQSPAKWPLVSHIECAKCGDPIDKNLLAQGGEKKRNAAFCHRCVCPDRGCINRAVVAPGYCAECIQRLESAKKSAESQLMQDAIDKLSELGQEVITAVEEFKQLLQRN